MVPIPSPYNISESVFAAALARYPAVIKAVSEAKSKPGQQTLEELDQFRHVTAPARFGLAGGGTSRAAMSLDDVKTLVAWKLKRGKFRPTLMKLVQSNDTATVETTVQEALAAYEAALSKSCKPDKGSRAQEIQAHAHASTVAVGILSRLRGIGPATASLLAAVHYPQQTIFFSDEAYAWLCGASGSGYQRPSKYNDKEYAELTKAAAELMDRLDTTAQDVEQAAYVLMNDAGSNKDDTENKSKEKKEMKEKNKKKSTAPKRKEPPTDAETGSRRSSRLRSG